MPKKWDDIPPMTAQPDRATYGLRPDILSQWETLAQSLSSIAPTAAPAMIIPLVIAAAGRSAWVSFVVATIAMALVAAHVNVFARDSATPGSLYAFVRGEFGSWVALPAGWALLVAYIGTAAAVTGGIIQYAQNLLGIAGTGIAMLLIILSIGLSAMLAYRNVELSTRCMLWIECASVATIVLLFVIPTRAHPLSWDPTQFAPSVFAVTPVGAGLVLATFAFVGFESATALGAEAKNPLTTIPRAVMGTALISGAFFVFSTYAEVDAVGSKVDLLTGTQAPLQVLATLKGRSWVGPIVSVGAIMSFFACAMSCITAAARTMFLMGAQKVLPSRLGQVHARHQTPSMAVIVSSIAAVVPALALAARHVSAFDLYGWLATIATYGFLAAYVFVTIAAPIYEWRRRTLTVPKAGLAVLTVAFLVWAFVASLPPATSTGPERWLAPIFFALIVAGCAYCMARRRLIVAGAMILLVATPARAQFTRERSWLKMPDGVRLAVTFWRPTGANEKLPVLLEYLPYRKEDSFYQRDYPLYSWFVRRGFIMAKVDIRGTGSSEGHLPDREYSEQEMKDADEIIAQLSRLPGSNGSVGLWGISWGGFNAIQIAMRHPPALKAIIAVDATDDLYHDDVHQIDGVLHIDQYALQIDHENGLPAPPAYAIDSAYVHNRFEAPPWILTYLHHTVDGPWWRWNSLRFQYDKLTIPCFLIGGLLDGYRDAIPRMLDSVHAPIKAIIGPWNHTFPDDAVPGPAIEWRDLAVKWWKHWLEGETNDIMDGPRLTVFVRDAVPPDVSLAINPGQWRSEDWPIDRTQWQTWYPDPRHELNQQFAAEDASWIDELAYTAGVGTAVPVWWNDATGDQAADDGQSLIYDSQMLRDPIEIIGFPRVRLWTSAGVPVADWTVRLEDVFPDGRVALVTGALQSGGQMSSRLDPVLLAPGLHYVISTPLHFTTWTFRPGHKIRLAIANSQFPMAWPTPYRMTMQLEIGDGRTALELPVVPPAPNARVPVFAAPQPHEQAPDARTLQETGYPGAIVTHDVVAKTTAVDFLTRFSYQILDRRIENIEKEHYETHDDAPAQSRFVGDESHHICRATRCILLRTGIDVQSDSTTLHVRVTRRLEENGRLVRTKIWTDTIPRGIN
jgi:predicted acyl esterase/amino acid transporter